MINVALIGAGNMGGALARGWSKSKQVLLTVADRNEPLLCKLREECPEVKVTTDNREAIRGAEIIVLVVKPWLMPDVIAEIRGDVDIERQIIISDAANYTTEKLETDFGKSGQYFYVIPNIGAEYGVSMSFIAKSLYSSEENTQKVLALYALCGETMLVSEQQVAAGMMMASCGIAYVMRMVRAMMEGGVEMGFYPQDAQNIVEQTMLGAVTLLRQSGLHPEVAIDKVTTPGGVTIKGLNELDIAGFNAAIIRCLRAGLK